MNILNLAQNKRKDFEHIEKIVSPTLSVENGKNGSVFYLDVNAPFKMVSITHRGYVRSILMPKYDGLNITYSKNSIIVTNPNKVTLKNNILLVFVGIKTNLENVKVYGWGQPFILADKIIPSISKQSVNRDDNLVDKSDITFT